MMPSRRLALEHCPLRLLSDGRPAKLAYICSKSRLIRALRLCADYLRFILSDLADHIEAGHALMAQLDCFVWDRHRWQVVFLDYDYTGAPWPQCPDGAHVGKGSFSLRSQRLLHLTRALSQGYAAENVLICRTHWRRLEVAPRIKEAR